MFVHKLFAHKTGTQQTESLVVEFKVHAVMYLIWASVKVLHNYRAHQCMCWCTYAAHCA